MYKNDNTTLGEWMYTVLYVSVYCNEMELHKALHSVRLGSIRTVVHFVLLVIVFDNMSLLCAGGEAAFVAGDKILNVHICIFASVLLERVQGVLDSFSEHFHALLALAVVELIACVLILVEEQLQRIANVM